MTTIKMTSSPPAFYRQPLFLFKIVLYVGTGILQPIIIDHLRISHCLGRKSLLLPTLAKTLGMALVGVLSTATDRSSLRRLLKTDDGFRKALMTAACVDMISGMMLTGGILLTGGAIFVVLYNSTPAWTALLSKYFLGKSLNRKQTTGVVIVCVGLIFNVFGTTEQLSHSQSKVFRVTVGSAIVLLGCILHAGFFVLSDRSLRGNTSSNKGDDGAAAPAVITPPLWSSCLGSMEALTMAMYIASSVGLNGFQPEGIAPDVCAFPSFSKGFCTMLFVDSVHSAAFFLMLRQIGAVGSALLKGIQSVAVVLLSAAFFCGVEEAQCLTTIKALSVCLVLAGTFLYAASSPSDIDRDLSAQKTDPPSVEIESLLDT